MVEPVSARAEMGTSGNNSGGSAYARSYAAMVLSAILPGLGQLYLGQFVKGVIIFLIFASAAGLFYLNSLPVTEWRDLLRFRAATQADDRSDDASADEVLNPDGLMRPYEIHIWTFDDGEKLMYRPSWKLKISSSVQGVLCWLYAVGNGWRGRRRARKR